MKIVMPTMDDADLKREVYDFLAGAIGAVEATRYERLALWQENRQHSRMVWEENLAGYILGAGEFGGMPVTIRLHTAVIGGHKVVFYDSPSQVTDSRIIEKWLEDHLPTSAWVPPFDKRRVNKTDAMNFHNIFPR